MQHPWGKAKMRGHKVTLPLRHLEDTYNDDWRPYGNVDVSTGEVEFEFEDYTKSPTIFNAKLTPGSNNIYGTWEGQPDSPSDDKKPLLDSFGIPITKPNACSWPSYKDYLGLSESYKYCSKCGKKEKDHE